MPSRPCLRLLVRGSAFLLVACALASGTSTWATAQTFSPLHFRVRATTQLVPGTDTQYVGIVTAMHADTLSLSDDGVVRVLPLDRIHQLEVSRGRRNRAPLGALIGAGVGVAFGVATVHSTEGGADSGIGIVVVPMGAALYGGIGALIGALIRTERWETVPAAQYRQP